ncbi:MAG: GFA family protein [Sorangiineae bacterium]|nr:GFA family protein [Polyangiaceae bacterium]MEB2324649.1 GFA family protein [Sorangiineae bacterium]
MTTGTHEGGCHCGAIRYRVELDLEAPAITCNCSICGKSGSYLQFVAPAQFTLERGEESLTDYQFNEKVIHHLFCKTCGIKAFARGVGPQGPMVAVNVRTLDAVDAFTIPTKEFPGLTK